MDHPRATLENVGTNDDDILMFTTNLPEGTMARKNSTPRRPQRIKHRLEDRVARRTLQRAAEDSYRHAPERTYVDGHLAIITFTDASFA